MSRAAVIFGACILLLAILWLVSRSQATTNNGSDDPSALTQKSGWKSFTSPAGEFEALFPTLPQHAQEIINDSAPEEQRKYDMFVAEQDDGSTFITTQITYPKGTEVKNLWNLYQTTVDEIVKSNPLNKLISNTADRFQGVPAMDFIIQNDKADVHGLTFMVDDTLYILTYLANKNQANQSDFDLFIKSFIVKKKEQEVKPASSERALPLR